MSNWNTTFGITEGGTYVYDRKGATAIVTILSVEGDKVTVKTKNGQVYQVPVEGIKRRIK